MERILKKAHARAKGWHEAYDRYMERMALNNQAAGDEAMNVIIGILVSLVLIGIVMRVISPNVESWTQQISTKFNEILGGNFGGTT